MFQVKLQSTKMTTNEPTLPTGQVVDSKNTLQSFDNRASDVRTVRNAPGVTKHVNAFSKRNTSPANPTLPSGEVIDQQ
jgi:hypothetical protein